MMKAVAKERVFKTAWFAKASKKARITDFELCAALEQVMLGQADDLGGGVLKKRLGKNLSIDCYCQRRPILGLRFSLRKTGSS